MLFRPALAVLALAVLTLVGSSLEAQEEPAPQPPDAIQHFFGPEAAEDQKEEAEPAAKEAKPEAQKAEPAAKEEPPRAKEEQPAAEKKKQPVAKKETRGGTAPVAQAPAPGSGTDAIQHFFGEAAATTEVRPMEPAKDQKDVKDGKKVDAFEHFFGEQETPAEEKPPA